MPRRKIADTEGAAAKTAGDSPLAEYRARRDFERTPEPGPSTPRTPARTRRGTGGAPPDGLAFVVQKHAARRLHYDLRLELGGVLKSWAVTRGPSLVAGEKRLAVETEDHPMKYLDFEGVIPAGEYGGGTMIVWDRGRWVPEGDPEAALAKGHLDFTLAGERLAGRWHLVRMRRRAREKRPQWLLLKSQDAFARAAEDADILETETRSLLSGRTNDELAAGGPVRKDHAARAAEGGKATTAGGPALPSAGKVKGARKGLLPVFVEPCLATLTESAPTGGEWLHEIKYDGYRIQARIDGTELRLLTRSGLDWTDRFPEVAAALAALKLGSALLDGEIIVEDAGGISSFSDLQADLKAGRHDRMRYHVFDLLYLDGSDLRRAPLSARKALLERVLASRGAAGKGSSGGVVRYTEHIDHDGDTVADHACRLGLEGIISKRRDAPYRSGRGGDWLKAKCVLRQEFVLAGYVPSTTMRGSIGSFALGYYADGGFTYAGRVGTGLSAAARALMPEFEALRVPRPPFAAALPAEARRGVRWIRPEIVAEIAFRGWTGDGLVRQAAFKGVREDKPPESVTREAPVTEPEPEPPAAGRRGRRKTAVAAKPALADPPPAADGRVAGVRLTHPERVLWEEQGVTKQGLADYYATIADWILPHVAGRPLSLVRCPSGAGTKCFFQKHAWAGLADAVRPVDVGDDTPMLAIDDLPGLIALVQAGVLEIHPWGARAETPDRPDRVIFDLDPGDGVPWSRMIDAARETRDRLAAAGLRSFVKTTGGKGLHVVAPLDTEAGWETVKDFARGIAEAMAADAPDAFVFKMTKRLRAGRIFVDYLRNGRGATAVAPYSTRARPGAPVAVPLDWDELSEAIRADHYSVETVPQRLRYLAADPWAEMATLRQDLPGAARPEKARRRSTGAGARKRG